MKITLATASLVTMVACVGLQAGALELDFSPSPTQRARLTDYSKRGSIGLVYHVRIGDRFAFDAWQQGVQERAEQVGGRRVYAGKPDPVAWEGMRFDVIWIDELPNAAAALEAVEQATSGSMRAVESLSVIAVDPQPRVVPTLLGWAAAVAHFVAPLGDEPQGSAESDVEASSLELLAGDENSNIWGDAATLRVAREQEQGRPLFMYNLNKLRAKAAYDRVIAEDADVSGEVAYRRYGDVAGLLRRGGYPFYLGSFVGHVAGNQAEPLADDWSHFILAYYPRRSEIFSMTSSESYAARRHHRDAALSRASLRFTTPWPAFDPTAGSLSASRLDQP